MSFVYEVVVWNVGTTVFSDGKEETLYEAEIAGHFSGRGASPAHALEMLAAKLRAEEKEKKDAEEVRSQAADVR